MNVEFNFKGDQLDNMANIIPCSLGVGALTRMQLSLLKYSAYVCSTRIFLLMTTKDPKYYLEVPNSEIVGIESKTTMQESEVAEGFLGVSYGFGMDFIDRGMMVGKESIFKEKINEVVKSLKSRFGIDSKPPVQEHEKYAIALVNQLDEIKIEISLMAFKEQYGENTVAGMLSKMF